MSDNGSGTYVVNSSGQPVVAATPITAAVHNALTADLATALSNRICKDGQTTVTANIPFGGYKATGLGAGTARTDGASLATIQDGTGVYVGTVGGTANAITLTPSPAIAAYVVGQRFYFIATSSNTGDTTIAISGLAAKTVEKITWTGSTILYPGDIRAGNMVTVTYTGTTFSLAVGTHPTEVSWTPSLGGTATYTAQTGRGWRLGMLVHVDCYLAVNAIGTGSTTLISGLPYSYYNGCTAPVWFSGSSTNVTSIVAQLANTTDVSLESTTAAQASMASNAIFKNGTAVRFSMTYLTNA